MFSLTSQVLCLACRKPMKISTIIPEAPGISEATFRCHKCERTRSLRFGRSDCVAA